MKSFQSEAPRRRVLVFAALAGVVLAGTALADAPVPVVEIVTPSTATYYVGGFPYNTFISFIVTHPTIHNVNNLDVLVDDVSLLGGPIADPFNNPSPNGCTAAALAALSSCTTPDGSTGNGVKSWAVPGPGPYSIRVRATNANSPHEGDDIETPEYCYGPVENPDCTVPPVEIEFACFAPPALANQYLNGTLRQNACPTQENPDPGSVIPSPVTGKKSISSRIRGCVIQQVAEKHAKLSDNLGGYYGPKGGPYDTNLVKADVLAFLPGCGY